MSLHVPSRGGNAVWAHRWRTHQGQMLIQEGANGTVTAHHIKLCICRRTASALHTVCLLFIYLPVCAEVCGVMSCVVVGECCISLIPHHTLQPACAKSLPCVIHLTILRTSQWTPFLSFRKKVWVLLAHVEVAFTGSWWLLGRSMFYVTLYVYTAWVWLILFYYSFAANQTC